ncbi:MAG: DNA-directed RNA polymerase subunit beta' [Candidatus Nealsonbacteria bacterium CG_4_10_14_0_8_um_filter_35_10]|uniref:DNA-directed RNA polymerase subunit beta' n=1 Tax=Candidatus Nealsonbacteria bacterium CG_4_10_14_0_8_um_filter_35_10 TaxID=1974683 RepID=A0A2M7R8Q3_9BACT|nr:MAG: DNA-directed RNA polymerase subunit beta' [Parcubacteria group bacterium CG1_02_36_42]PIY91055.1 MAG: DNA-directed RNA polymerase subunit beta' [Candidatus Nealsonbacteria bacterium CG_4_10_14_0_8_um_filter_35_10]
MRVTDLQSIKIKLASPEEILAWSHGEVTKPETINYRTQRPEKDGLFCERIFGPTKDYQCYCGKYKRIRYKGIVCDRCGVEVTKSSVRRERMGHIKLACPVSHIWFLRGVPSRMGMVLDISLPKLERVIYFAAYIITKVDQEGKKKILLEIEKEYKSKSKTQRAKSKNKKELKTVMEELKSARDRAREEVLNLQPLRVLSEVRYHELSFKYGQIFEAGTGAETLRKIFEKIDLKAEIDKMEKELKETLAANRRKILRRLKVFQSMLNAKIRPEWMFLTVLPVLPPDLRPMVQLDGGRYASSDLNDLYRRVINRNSRLKYLLEINAPEVIVRNEKRMLQEAVDALIDNGMRKGVITKATTGGRRLLKSLADMLKGKQGRFRQNLLGKRVDYSGRSVIVVGPELKLNQCGLPKEMALELFKPFVIKGILEKELAYNVRAASKFVDEESEEVWAILEEVVKNKLVLLNRAPTLHRLGIQAFEPRLIEGEVIEVHPLVCRAFNADFDGDQMAVHLPLSEEAQREAREIMFSTLNLLKPATGLPVVTPTQDIILGCYLLTRIIKEGAKGEGKIFANFQEASLAYEFGLIDLRAKIKARMKNSQFLETSVGRIIFNQTLPEGHPFVNELINSKKLEKIINEIVADYGREKAVESLDKIKDLGFEYATLLGPSWGIDDLKIPAEKEKIVKEADGEIEAIESDFRKGLLTEEEKYSKTIEVWQKAKSEIEKVVPQSLPPEGPVFSIVDSGARGSWAQPVQMCGMKGLVINPLGEIIRLPIKSSYKEGFDVLEYFISTHGARKGTVDTALRTSMAGYLTRRLVDVAHEVIISEEDCGDKQGIEIFRKDADEIGQNFVFKILGRMVLEDVKPPTKSFSGGKDKKKVILKKGEIINWEKAESIISLGIEKIRVRSPLSCRSVRGVCQKCYGWELGTNQLVKLGEAVGIIAAQAIGEPGTQLTLRTFHTGGVAGGGDITFGLPRVEELLEARPLVEKGALSPIDGKVIEITKDRIIRIKPKGNPHSKNEVLEFKISPRMAIWVKEGEEVKKGQQLSEGNLDLKEVSKLRDKTETQRYVIKEIQRIYVSQGAIIHDKHLEIVTRQMFSRIRIKDGGDSSFVPGEIVERTRFLEENKTLKEKKKEPAKGNSILLGISRVALTSDSFLSAASFQETTRVLIKAALEGKEDRLHGLKENVIIGKLIPAGTGFRKNSEK